MILGMINPHKVNCSITFDMTEMLQLRIYLLLKFSDSSPMSAHSLFAVAYDFLGKFDHKFKVSINIWVKLLDSHIRSPTTQCRGE